MNISDPSVELKLRFKVTGRDGLIMGLFGIAITVIVEVKKKTVL